MQAVLMFAVGSVLMAQAFCVECYFSADIIRGSLTQNTVVSVGALTRQQPVVMHAHQRHEIHPQLCCLTATARKGSLPVTGL